MTEPTELHLFGEDDDQLAPVPGRRRRGRVRSPRKPSSGVSRVYGGRHGLLFGKWSGEFWFSKHRPDRNQGKLDLK